MLVVEGIYQEIKFAQVFCLVFHQRWVYTHKLFLMGIKIRLACVSWVDLLNAHTSSGVWHTHPLGIHKGARQYRYSGFTRHSHSRRHRQAVKTCFPHPPSLGNGLIKFPQGNYNFIKLNFIIYHISSAC